MKAPWFSKVQPIEDKFAFNLNPGFLSLRQYIVVPDALAADPGGGAAVLGDLQSFARRRIDEAAAALVAQGEPPLGAGPHRFAELSSRGPGHFDLVLDHTRPGGGAVPEWPPAPQPRPATFVRKRDRCESAKK